MERYDCPFAGCPVKRKDPDGFHRHFIQVHGVLDARERSRLVRSMRTEGDDVEKAIEDWNRGIAEGWLVEKVKKVRP